MQLTIESVDHEGQGVARSAEGKTVFVEGALAGELVEVRVTRKKPNYDKAVVEQVVTSSVSRVTPRCPHFGVCGGCSMQHLDPHAQVAVKQRVLEDNLQRIGGVTPDTVFPPIVGPFWGYRHRARLSVRHVEKKGGVLVGFHEKRSSYVADMHECHVLPKHISDLLPKLRVLIGSLSIRDRAPQIEYAEGDGLPVLVLRNLEAPSEADLIAMKAFAQANRVQWYLQPKGPETAQPLPGEAHVLGYKLQEFGLRYPFSPTEFTQVNPHINEMLVRKAIRWLDIGPQDRIGDFFCGLGNFTLPIAQRAQFTYGVEGSQALVNRAKENAALNGLSERTDFAVANLFEIDAAWCGALPQLDKWLVDPPRDGALELVKSLPDVAPPEGGQPIATATMQAPKRIVYVSCNPATLARDAGVLVHQKGYRMRGAGIANMFPHTAHVESIAVFDRIA